MGSKQGILSPIWNAIKHLPFTSVLDAFSGSGYVGYLFKSQGKLVISNDFLKYAYHLANSLVANADETLAMDDVAMLLEPNAKRQNFIVVSYSSNSLPTREELTEMLKSVKDNVIAHTIKHQYSFGTHAHKVGNQNNAVQEYVFVAY